MLVESAYADINGLRMYYEIYGEGKPLVLIHGGGSTIQTTFANLIPLMEEHHQLIAVEMQAHGRTSDRDNPLSFEQDADDIAALLQCIGILKASLLGFSNGGQTAIAFALRHPEMLDNMIVASAFYKRSAAPPEFWNGFDKATLNDMPVSLQEGFLKINNSHDALANMFRRDVERMKSFKGWTDEEISSITTPALIISASRDVGSLQHTIEMYETFPNRELAVFPGTHGGYLGAAESLEDGKMPLFNAVPLILEFLNKN